MPTKKLIEVALPIKEISAESVRDKSIRHGHISTLHLWWARRPLPVCRAVVFASLVPDPLDEECPPAFREAVDLLLGRAANPGDPYKPYTDIPYTAAVDLMEDNLRNRLLMFIGKFSDKYADNERMGKATPAKDLLSNASLIKWDNKNNEAIMGKARKLIWVAHNAHAGQPATELLADFDRHWKAIRDAESALYTITDRHLPTPESNQAQAALEAAINAFLDRMPRVFDPFAGGGAIPLEAARLGCRSYGNDLNPVAHIIQKGSLEFPQKYGKPIVLSKDAFIAKYGEAAWKQLPAQDKFASNGEAVRIANRLAFDVEHYAKKLLQLAEEEIGHFYPANEKGDKPIAYYWARVAKCSNPSCRAEVPLLKQFYLANTKGKKVHLEPSISGKEISFSIKSGEIELEGWNYRGNLKCPCCGNVTDVKQIKEQSVNETWTERLLAVIEEGKSTKNYRLPTKEEETIINSISAQEVPTERMQRNSAGGDTFSWGVSSWGQMFSPRQLLALHTLVKHLQTLKDELRAEEDEYGKAVVTYLAVLVDRIVIKQNSFIFWDVSRETVSNLFGRQAIPMVFDYVESNLFCSSAGSASNQLDWICRYIESESFNSIHSVLNNASSGDKSQFADKSVTAVVTDPPYYDAIAYADLSDFFYVWLKRTLGDLYPLTFATPQTPKSEECTALKHYHKSKELAKKHFEDKLTKIFDAIEHQTSDVVSIMFAHQSTEAWTTLCNSILGARMNITGSWPVDTEMANRSLGLAGAVLESSVTVSARPSQRIGVSNYRVVKKAIEDSVAQEIEELYSLGFRGADLLTACFGKAVSEFGKYERVEKSDGSEVTVADLLELSRDAALKSLLMGFEGDEYSKFYIGWLQLNGFGETDFNDATNFTRIAVSVNVQDIFKENILIRDGKKQHLGSFKERIAESKNLGLRKDNNFLIDQAHRAMFLWSGTRKPLVDYIREVGANPDSPFWRILTSISELAKGTADAKVADELLANKDNLIREAKEAASSTATQTELF